MSNVNKKQDFINSTEKMFEQARTVYCYFEILVQYYKNLNVYNEGHNISTAFYTCTRQALITASFLEIYKTCNTNKGSKNIKKLFDNLEQQKK